jgi:hypothetical protein
MSKKAEKVKEVPAEESAQDVLDNIDPKKLEEARESLRARMKERFGEWLEVSDETATDDDITAARKEFEDKVAVYTNKQYEMSSADKAIEMVEFIKAWNAKYNHWEKGAWRGVVNLDTVLEKKLEELKSAEESKAFEVDYQTLMFLYKSMQNPNGYGIESAREMAELEQYDVVAGKVKEGHEDDMTYSKVVNAIMKNTTYLQSVDKMLKLYQERINLAAAGIKFTFKITELEEFNTLHEAWVTNNVDHPND